MGTGTPFANDLVVRGTDENSDKLFVYGTLQPGQHNEHLLARIEGTWRQASVTGSLEYRTSHEGWQYPVLSISEQGYTVQGLIFTSKYLEHNWAVLDAFEGDEYTRSTCLAMGRDGTRNKVFIYASSGKHAITFR